MLAWTNFQLGKLQTAKTYSTRYYAFLLIMLLHCKALTLNLLIQIRKRDFKGMRKVLIIHAHPESKSFCSSLKNEAVSFFQSQDKVRVSDLYAMGF